MKKMDLGLFGWWSRRDGVGIANNGLVGDIHIPCLVVVVG